MDRPQSELGSFSKELLTDLERLRPGWPVEATREEMTSLIRHRIHTRLRELFRERYGNITPELQEQQTLFAREIDQILVPRYALLAEQQNQRELTPKRFLRGRDLSNRIFYTVLFFLIGLFSIWAPFIPIWEKWFPFLLMFVAPLVSPFLPDVAQRLENRRYRFSLTLLTYDLDQAGLRLPETPIDTLLLESRDSRPTS